MKFDNLMDMHIHSDNSFDGKQSCMLLCEKAVELGAAGIAITDHCDIDSKKEDFRALCTNQFVETFECKRYFEGRLLILQGLEIGQATYNTKLSNHILNKFNYDFVLGSIHNLPDMEDFYFLDYSKFNIDDLLNQYFEKELEITKWNGFDSLAHLTYPLRYIVGEQNISVDMSKYDDIIEEIMKSLIFNGKALEINTSGLTMKLKDTLPGKKYIKMFKDLGGEFITIGSDAHHSSNILNNVEDAMTLAMKCGFENITVFNRREPILIPIK